MEATTEPYDMALQRMVGHLPGILHPNPKSVLGIGFACPHLRRVDLSSGVEHITICEIEPVIPPTSTRFFAKQNYEVRNNPKTHIVLMTPAITCSPPPTSSTSSRRIRSTYSRKARPRCIRKNTSNRWKNHLNPGGFFTLYVPLYESDLRTVKSELATFFDVFPNATIWANTIGGQGYDMVFMGQAQNRSKLIWTKCSTVWTVPITRR